MAMDGSNRAEPAGGGVDGVWRMGERTDTASQRSTAVAPCSQEWRATHRGLGRMA